MDSITIIMPYPDKRLNAHAKGHWRGKNAATAIARDSAHKISLAALGGHPPPRWTRAKMMQVFYFPQNNRQDLINFAQMCKAAVDGIVDAGVISDDNHTVLRPTTQDFGGYDKKNPRVEITITPAEP